MSLYHAYIIEGEKEQAREHVFSLLKENGLLPTQNQDSVIGEFVNFSISDARALKEWQILSSTNKTGKAYVAICDFINIEAQNALLKTFEEPTPNTHIFLVVGNSDTLLDTLISRVEKIKLDRTSKNLYDISSFVRLSIPEKIKFVEKICEKGDDESASAQVRSNAIHFLNELEYFLAKDARTNKDKITKIIDLKKYLNISGCSVKMILESIAFLI